MGRQNLPPPLTALQLLVYTSLMTKLKNPLLSFLARGSIAYVSFVNRRRQNIAEKKPVPKDAKTSEQLAWRTMYQLCVDLWHTLSTDEKREWESAGTARHMTGYAWYMSQCLRPNPGIYLPLLGGTMQGVIDMGKNRLLKLPLPTDDQEAASKKYHDDNLPVGGFTQGARVYNSAGISIPNGAETVVAFDSQRYDTDGIHSTVLNTARLTCKTAGKYIIIGQGRFDTHATGVRYFYIRLNGSTLLALFMVGMDAIYRFSSPITTIYDLAVDDYVEFVVYQNSGGNLTLSAAPNHSPEFMMQRIG